MRRFLIVLLLSATAHAEEIEGWKVISGEWKAEGKTIIGQNGYLAHEQGTWKNFKLTAQIQIVEWGEGKAAAGLRLRAALPGGEENCYRLLLRPDQHVTFDKVLKGKWIQLHSTKADLRPGKWFKVGFAAKGGRMQVYFNGKKIYAFTDKEPILEGAIVLWVQQPKAAFKDIKIKIMK